MEQFDQNSLCHLLTLAETNSNCNEHKDFWEWNNETAELVNKLEKMGQIEIEPSINQYDLQYWGADVPIQIDKYPYYGCEVFKCKTCGTVFFYYLELGGHAPQKRYRVIRKELIAIENV
ncbi:hypothetical protein IC229_32870 [Spirosoma sp. BT702]|uniref:Uncharacterized protein n=1 Tax=Spirosoma profusum TaxID=2771354 RepID=A0A927AVZ8_9BACT|nr:hypothetical protein [Spirosoma profusum]MBD2705450.1 hypothetical protein [Spirosoma profusum]